VELICGRGCGFRVDSEYFIRKTRFSAGVCARCSGPISIVDDGTDDVVAGARILLRAEGAHRAGEVV